MPSDEIEYRKLSAVEILSTKHPTWESVHEYLYGKREHWSDNKGIWYISDIWGYFYDDEDPPAAEDGYSIRPVDENDKPIPWSHIGL